MKYQILKCEERVTPTGKKLKKVMLEGEGAQYIDKNVTVWEEDFPEFDSLAVGGTVEGFVERKDSGTPIPEFPGKNYVNRTLYKEERNANGTVKPAGSPLLEARVAKLEAKVFGEAPQSTDEINPDDIPF